MNNNSNSLWLHLVLFLLGGAVAVTLLAVFPMYDLVMIFVWYTLLPLTLFLSLLLSAYGGYNMIKGHWNSLVGKGREFMEESIRDAGASIAQGLVQN
jgi:hypothetical protein